MTEELVLALPCLASNEQLAQTGKLLGAEPEQAILGTESACEFR